jgi:hypothetical protein
VLHLRSTSRRRHRRRKQRARFKYVATLPDGSTTSARALSYYRFVDGKIVLNDVMFDRT